MADILRGPLYATRRELAPVLQLGAAFVVPSPLQVMQPKDRLVQNADTSHGSPKGLLADKQLPFFVAPHIAPAPRRPDQWLNASTTAGTPKGLLDDKQLPFFVAPFFAQTQHRATEWL